MIIRPCKTWRGICSIKLPMLHLEIADPLARLKLFGGSATWWIAQATAYSSSGECGLNDCCWDPRTNVLRSKVTHEVIEDVRLYGCADLHERELGYASLREISQLRLPLFQGGRPCMPVERDLHFEPQSVLAVRYDDIGQRRPQ